jgi:alpha-L-fucosidase
MIGAYFSKPDWNTKDYWWKYFPPKTRNVSYDPKKYPERWEGFKQFTYNQVEELMKDYGKDGYSLVRWRLGSSLQQHRYFG